jgi:formyltetrahydrofolate synthetase
VCAVWFVEYDLLWAAVEYSALAEEQIAAAAAAGMGNLPVCIAKTQ